jgi:hypothetical protein
MQGMLCPTCLVKFSCDTSGNVIATTMKHNAKEPHCPCAVSQSFLRFHGNEIHGGMKHVDHVSTCTFSRIGSHVPVAELWRKKPCESRSSCATQTTLMQMGSSLVDPTSSPHIELRVQPTSTLGTAHHISVQLGFASTRATDREKSITLYYGVSSAVLRRLSSKTQ